MGQQFRWDDINTNFGGVSAMAAVAANSRRHNMDMMNKFRDDHNASILAEEELARTQGTGNMLIDQAAGKEVDFSQPHDSLAYYKDAQQFANDKRDYDIDATKANAMNQYYEHQTKMNNMTDREKAKANLMKSIFSGSGKSKKSGGSKSKSSGSGNSAFKFMDDLAKTAGFDGSEWFGGMDREDSHRLAKQAMILFPNDKRKREELMMSATEVDETGPNSLDILDEAAVVEEAKFIKNRNIARKMEDNAMQKFYDKKLADKSGVYIGY